ncbi:MerR family transcriptional regulator [Streptomyces broussonetiae]|uniref:MerR family transcriptional regulator n=1 Tax=Streptomyces broussonetiae TaxID=2686304 RepID=A0A6I6N5B9_9ACTN|nr:MerR family transcriptional regulator [Streptomyces broussonetiae]QHA05240.1 MerR family transcriptional regulator [Streptomyces broussonetiae]
MHDGTLYSIGELARRTGLSVKTIRFYSDRGLVVPADRTAAGYRRYGPDAMARLALVRALRELGLGLDVIGLVLDRPPALGRIAAEQVAALDVQISALRLRRAVLSALAGRAPTLEEAELMHRLATLSETERRRLFDDFLDTVFANPTPSSAPVGTHATAAATAAARRSMTPEPPADPTGEQVAAWLELAELALDDGFRAAVRRLVGEYGQGVSSPPRPDTVALARELAGPVVAAGTRPDAPQAEPVVAALLARCGPTASLLRRLESARDPRRDRYFQLLALVNGWPAPEPTAPLIDWTVTALRAHAQAA